MENDIALTVPSVLIQRIHSAADQACEVPRRKAAAVCAYTHAALADQARTLRRNGQSELRAMASAIDTWGLQFRQALLPRTLQAFSTANNRHPFLLIAIGNVELPKREDFPGGKLRTELQLALEPAAGLFRRREFFEGFRMACREQLQDGELYALIHPTMLRRLHAAIGSQSALYSAILAGLDRMTLALGEDLAVP